jgi:short-subunit dehydrogenase
MKDPATILITGASSGVGAALARAYAAPGVLLHLGGRNAERLAAVARDCTDRGASVRPATVDVAERPACERWIRQSDAGSPLDLVVANAGVSAGTAGGAGLFEETAETVRRVFAVNVEGVLNTVLPAVDVMRGRGRGQIAIVSSLASFLGSPGAGAYCATKAAERLFGEALRRELAPQGVEVSVICPGFVRSPMTAGNPFYMPFLMEADEAARIIRKGLARNKGRIAFPWPMYLLVLVAAMLPNALMDLASRPLPRKA